MADTKMEFSELSKLYSDAKNKYPKLETDIKALKTLEQKISDYESRIKLLEEKKYTRQNRATFNTFLGTKSNSNTFDQHIDSEIDKLKNELTKLRNDTLLKRKDELEEASNELNSYIEMASTNLDFQESLLNTIIGVYNTEINDAENRTKLPKQTIAIISKLETLAKRDPYLKNILSIDDDKQKLKVLNDVISDITAKKSNDSQDTKKNEALKILNDQVQSLKKEISNKGRNLQKYITKHKGELGLPSHARIDFNDVFSPLYFISQIRDSKSSDTLISTKNLFTEKLYEFKCDIEHTEKCKEIADQELNKLKTEKEKELEDLSLYPETGKWATIKRFVKAPFKLVKNFFYGVKKPWKDILKKPDIQEVPTKSNIVDTEHNFLDAYKTDIGRDVLIQIMRNHDKKVKDQRQSAQRQNSSHEEHSL